MGVLSFPELPVDWGASTIGDVVTVKGGKRLPKGEKLSLTPTAHPYIRVTDFSDFSVNAASIQYITDNIYKKICRYTISSNEVYISIAGSIGIVGMVPDVFDGANLTENAAKLTVDLGNDLIPQFLMYWLSSDLSQREISAQRVQNAQPKLALARIKSLSLPIPPLPEQRRIAAVLSLVQQAIEQQERLIALTTELKKALMHKLFTEGTRGEPQKQTEIGPVPKSWEAVKLGSCCDVANSSISYTKLLKMDSLDSSEAVDVMGVKVADMNLPGNEEAFITANLIRRLSPELAKKKTVPAGAIVFPKRGAAIATNKKRVTTTWTVLDPNLIAVVPGEKVIPGYLYYWSQIFDLRKITDPGPTPQLNKKDVVPVLFPLPQDPNEQDEIANTLGTVDKSIGGYRDRLFAMQALFRTLLHLLMTAEIRVNDLDLEDLGIEGGEEQEEAI